ncbi:hypothetical protein ASD54_17280 [Rhizobium sp. Root149]|uniref:pectate lyase n=1 Tax=Rhizobium sp. Root149 TaxID=1736473 RepID=UPI0007144CF1|nr:pectate lyase [Rhizobium sp. Root149]KQZ48612.1 hypothetical protein ASD54_17280 [Rhizobium sp. Root149]
MASEITGMLQQLVQVLSKLISMLSSMFGGGQGNGGAGGGSGSGGAGGGQGNGGAGGGHGSGGAGGGHGSGGAGGGQGSGGAGGGHGSGGAGGGHGSGGAGGGQGSGGAGGGQGSGGAGGGHGSGGAGGGQGSGGAGGGQGSGGAGGGQGSGGAGGGQGSGGAGGSTRSNEPEDTTNKGKVNVVDKTIVVDGTEFDGKGATYTASSKLGDGGQGEGQQPIFILKNGATLKNVTIGDNGADGIHVYGGATLKNVHWKDVGEDALTVKSPGDLNVIGGSASQAADKVFQVNADSNIYIKDFKADGFQTFVRTNGGQPITSNVTIEGGEFTNGKTLFRTDSKTSEVNFVGEMSVQEVATKVRYLDQKEAF